MECIKLGTIYHSIMMLDQDVTTGIERVENNRSSISQLDLKDRLVVLSPPLFARRSVIFSEFQKMAEDRKCAWNFWYSLDVLDICTICPL